MHRSATLPDCGKHLKQHHNGVVSGIPRQAYGGYRHGATSIALVAHDASDTYEIDMTDLLEMPESAIDSYRRHFATRPDTQEQYRWNMSNESMA
jgi:hypothetical protein